MGGYRPLLISAVIFAVCAAVSASASGSSFVLSEETASQLGGSITYQSEQRIYRLTQGDSYTAEIPASSAVYMFVVIGGYESGSGSGDGDNGVSCGCEIIPVCVDKNGGIISAYDKVFTPADGTFGRYSIGADDKYSGLPDGTDRIRLTIKAVGARQYIRALEIHTSDTIAADLTLREWETHTLGNINAQTTRADYWIMVGFVAAVAAVMIVFAKLREKYRKGKKL